MIINGYQIAVMDFAIPSVTAVCADRTNSSVLAILMPKPITDRPPRVHRSDARIRRLHTEGNIQQSYDADPGANEPARNCHEDQDSEREALTRVDQTCLDHVSCRDVRPSHAVW